MGFQDSSTELLQLSHFHFSHTAYNVKREKKTMLFKLGNFPILQIGKTYLNLRGWATGLLNFQQYLLLMENDF